jgi:hypothetical protein
LEQLFMRSRLIVMGAAWSLLAFRLDCAVAATAPVRSPATAQEFQDKDVLERAAQALESYVALCRAHDRKEAMNWVTRRLAVEYLSANAGIVEPTADLIAFPDPCLGARDLAGSGHLSDLWVLPTGARDSVYVEFALNGKGRRIATSADHVAMLIRHGSRIASVRIFLPAYDQARRHDRLRAHGAPARPSTRNRGDPVGRRNSPAALIHHTKNSA